MADKDDKKIAKPTCPKCGKHEFKHEAVKSSGSSAGVYVVFCIGCGHIIGVV